MAFLTAAPPQLISRENKSELVLMCRRDGQRGERGGKGGRELGREGGQKRKEESGERRNRECANSGGVVFRVNQTNTLVSTSK